MSSLQTYNFKNLTASGNYIVQNNPGCLHTVLVNTTSTGTIVIYDGVNAAGNTIASIDASPIIGNIFRYDVQFSNGLMVAMSGASDITLSIG
jgi:hypothetical protein